MTNSVTLSSQDLQKYDLVKGPFYKIKMTSDEPLTQEKIDGVVRKLLPFLSSIEKWVGTSNNHTFIEGYTACLREISREHHVNLNISNNCDRLDYF